MIVCDVDRVVEQLRKHIAHKMPNYFRNMDEPREEQLRLITKATNGDEQALQVVLYEGTYQECIPLLPFVIERVKDIRRWNSGLLAETLVIYVSNYQPDLVADSIMEDIDRALSAV